MPARPLAGKTVLLCSSPQTATSLALKIEALGGRVLSFPTIEIRETADTTAIDRALDKLTSYDWIIFTSAYGVRFFFKRINERQLKPVWTDVRVCAVGPATAAALERNGVRAMLVPEGEFRAEGVLESLSLTAGSLARSHILIPGARESREVLPAGLKAMGATVETVACYENSLPRFDEGTLSRIRSETPAVAVFTSSSTVINFYQLLGEGDATRLLARARVAVLGPISAETMRSKGREPDIQPVESTTDSLVRAIADYFGES